MAKLWKVVKVIIFSVGALTLALIAYGLIMTFVPPLFKTSKHQETAALSEEVVFEKKEGAYSLQVKSREAGGPAEYLVTLSKDGRPVVQSFRLPTQEQHLEYVHIYDASFVPLRGGEQGVILYSAYEDDEGTSDSHIWFLKAADTMSVRDVIELSDVNSAEIEGLTILGNRKIVLPYQEGFRSEQFLVPIVVRVSDTIDISPLLSREGLDVLFSVLKHEVRVREEKMPKEKNHELAEGYRKAGKEMGEAFRERSIPY